MDWSIKKNRRYMIALLIFFFAVPHIIMSLPGFSELTPESWNTKATINRYWYSVWVAVPFSGGIISLLHVLRRDQFCPILVIEAALAMLTYLPRIDVRFVLILSLSVLIILLMESFALLKHFDRTEPAGAKLGFLAGVVSNRQLLALFCFCSVIVPCIFQIPLVQMAVPRVVMVLPILQSKRLKEAPLTMGGVVTILLFFVISVLLVTTLYLHFLWQTYLTGLVAGYVGFFLMYRFFPW